MHIVHATGYVSLKYGGMEKWFVRLADECRRRGHRLTFLWERQPSNEVFSRDFEAAGGRALVFPVAGRAPASVLRLRRWLRVEKAIVLHAHFNPTALLALTAGCLAGVRVRLNTLHGGFTADELRQAGPRQRLTVRLRSLLSHRVLAVSHTVRDQFVSLGLSARKSQVHYLGIEAPPEGDARGRMRAEFSIAPDAPVVVCLAFHDPVKGVDVLLRAMTILRSVLPGVRLLQVGESLDSRQTRDIHRMADELGLGDTVIWAGQRNDARTVLQAGDVYCQPSRSVGLPLAILEAAAGGLPVVAARVGGIPEAVVDGETGLLVPPESPEALAQALKALLGDAQRRRAMGAAGRTRTAAQFDLGRQTERLVDLYETLAASAGASHRTAAP